jgi:hypothetical protein
VIAYSGKVFALRDSAMKNKCENRGDKKIEGD